MSGLGLYRAFTTLAEPFAPFILQARARHGKEAPRRMAERLGRSALARPAGPLVWLHGASVGESLSMLPLIDRIRAERPGVTILVTSGTVTSADLLAKRLPVGVIHQFAPIDGPGAVGRFLDHWRPDTGLFVESELWPNLLTQARVRGVRLGLVSARITQHSAEGWAKRPKAAKTLLSGFSLILAQDQASAERLGGLGAVTGPLMNLKYVAGPLPGNDAAAFRIRRLAGARGIVVAASTHAGEETLIAQACPPGPVLVMAVRHPGRGPAVAEELRALGRTVTRRGAGDLITGRTDVYVADTLGEMGLWYRLAQLVVMGGGFASGVGGHNPLEPARLNAPVVSGPDVFNFADIYRDLAARDAVVLTKAPDLAGAIADLMAYPSRRQAMADRARAFAEAQGDAFETGWSLIAGLLP
jgi:3-deoxy-D-manno-octulosonic-acid transferase